MFLRNGFACRHCWRTSWSHWRCSKFYGPNLWLVFQPSFFRRYVSFRGCIENDCFFLPNRKLVFQPLFLRGELLNFRSVCIVTCAMVKSRYIGDGHPTFNRESLYWVYKPLRTWVDDHPLLYWNNRCLDPSTHWDFHVPSSVVYCRWPERTSQLPLGAPQPLPSVADCKKKPRSCVKSCFEPRQKHAKPDIRIPFLCGIFTYIWMLDFFYGKSRWTYHAWILWVLVG